MRTAWKVLAVVGALALLLVAGAYVALSTLDLNAFIGPVKDRVKALTGRELTIRGDARLALSMQPRLVLTDVALGNAPWATAKEMVTAERLELELALLPLLSRRFELTEVALVGPVVALETDAKGQRNWDLGKRSGAAAGADDAGTPAALRRRQPRDHARQAHVPRRRDRRRDARRDRSLLAPRAQRDRRRSPRNSAAAIDDVPVAVEGTLGPAGGAAAAALAVRGGPQGRNRGPEDRDRDPRSSAAGTRYQLDDLKISLGANALTGSFAVRTRSARARSSSST